MIHVIRRIERPDPALITQLAAFGSATVHEVQARQGELDPRIKPVDRSMKVCGPAVTVQCIAGDNLALQAGIAVAGAGDVLVVDVGPGVEFGYFGDVLATACQAKGIAGLAISGGVRDTESLRAMGFAVFSGTICIRGTVKETMGTVNHSVVCGGQVINPGDAILGDADGVVVVPRASLSEVIRLSAAREEKEAGIRAALLAGGSALTLLGMDKVLAAKGCRWEEE